MKKLIALICLVLGLQSAMAWGQPLEKKFPERRTGSTKKKSVVRSGGLQTTDLSGRTALELANALVGSGVTVSNVKYTGANRAAGSFTGGNGIIGFDSGIILSSGDISNVVGPNSSDEISTDNGQPGDADLNSLVSGYSTNDATVLEFDFVPTTTAISFQFVFSSDEYNEWVGSKYNDVFGVIVNGQTVDLLPNVTTAVPVNNINLNTNSQYYINNDLDDAGGAINTEMDGLTRVLNAHAVVNPNQVNTIKLAIADAGDHIYDSNVFIKTDSFSADPQAPQTPQAKRKVILIKGTWNASRFGSMADWDEPPATPPTLINHLKAEGYLKENILLTPLHMPGVVTENDEGSNEGGRAPIKDSVQYIHERIVKRWNPEDYPDGIDVDIIAHSAGGLAARYLINRYNDFDPVKKGQPFLRVHNLITLGTPYGGIRAAGDWRLYITGFIVGGVPGAIVGGVGTTYGVRGVGGPIIKDMRTSVTYRNRDYGPLDSEGNFIPWNDDNHTGFRKEGITNYWGIGGYDSFNADLLYGSAFLTEPKLYDGLVNIRSAYGRKPGKSVTPKCDDQFRMFLANHSELVRDQRIINDYILPVLRDGTWSNCDSILGKNDAAGTDSSQLVEVRGISLETAAVRSFNVPIDSAKETTFVASSPVIGGLTLSKPDGEAITPATAADSENIHYSFSSEEGAHLYTYTVNLPDVGIWTAHFTPTEASNDNEAAEVTVTVENSLEIEGGASQEEYSNGTAPQLRLTVTENGEARPGGSVIAMIGNDAGDVVTKTLLDDGLNNDGAANDGVFGALLEPLNDGGIYNIVFKAMGVNTAGEQYQRLAASFFTIGPATAMLTKTYADQLLNTDADDTSEFLKVDVGVSVTQTGSFLVEGKLKDEAGNVIETVSGSAQNLTPGIRVIPLLFNGRTILKHGQPGPYKLTDVSLYADTPERPIWIETDESGHTTQPYAIAEFDHPPLLEVLQPDTSNPLVDTSFNIVFRASDEDNAAKVDLYYCVDKTETNGTLIQALLPADGERFVTWDTTDVPVGSYYIYAVASDGIRPPVTAYSSGLVHVRVQAGFNISGRIATASGAPIEGVSLTRTGGSTPVLTNGAGYYTFSGVSNGSVTITPSKSGYIFTPESRTVTVNDANVTGQNFVGSTGHRISGRIADSSGIGQPGMSVMRSGSTVPVLTNSAGYFNFTNVPDGTVTITPTGSGTIFTPATRTVTVDGADMSGLNFIRSTGYKISGRIYGREGIALVNLRVVRSGSRTPVFTNSAGYYDFQDVPNGSYIITPQSDDLSFTPESRTVTMNGANIGGQNFMGSSEPVISLYRITGRITASNGNGLANVAVTRSGLATPVFSNSTGHYSFDDVPNGSYIVTPSLSGYTFAPVNRAAGVNDADAVDHNFIGSLIPPAPTYVITGRITSTNGNALANVTVTRSGSSTPVTTNSSGQYTFTGVANGTYTITPTLNGHLFTPTSTVVTVNNSSAVERNFVGRPDYTSLSFWQWLLQMFGLS